MRLPPSCICLSLESLAVQGGKMTYPQKQSLGLFSLSVHEIPFCLGFLSTRISSFHFLYLPMPYIAARYCGLTPQLC